VEEDPEEEEPPKAEARALPTGATSFSSVEMIEGAGAPAAAEAPEASPPIDFFTVFSTTFDVSAVPCTNQTSPTEGLGRTKEPSEDSFSGGWETSVLRVASILTGPEGAEDAAEAGAAATASEEVDFFADCALARQP